MPPIVWSIIVFVILLFLGFPIAFTLGISSLACCIFSGNIEFFFTIPLKMFGGMDNFIIMAIPLFMLTGHIMNEGKITDQLVNFSELLVGRFKGGLAYVNIISSMFFAGITGSALSDIAALGSMLIPTMVKNGYDEDFSAAVTAASAIQGPIIPPSIPAVLLAGITGISTGALFLGGAIPGVLLGLGCCVVVYFVAEKRKYPSRKTKYSWQDIFIIVKNSILALLAPIIILGGLTTGIFTPTEAAGIAVLYSFILSVIVFKSLDFSKLVKVCKITIIGSAKIYFILGAASIFSWFLSMEGVPQLLANWITFLGVNNRFVMLIIINLFLLFWGMWMSGAAGILILAPIMLPIIEKVGIHPVHFGVIMILNLMIGLITPPFGTGLYSALAITKVPLVSLLKELWPFLLIEILVLALITFIPAISLFLPRLFNLI